MAEYIQPKKGNPRFTCPYCNTLSIIYWDNCVIEKYSDGYHVKTRCFEKDSDSIDISTCVACDKYHVWFNDKMIYPIISGIPMPNDDMPECVKEVYMEAREVFMYSKRASAALLRLALQLLCKELGGKGKNINDDIACLVKNGLSIRVQQALDSIRVIGNNAVHPGTIELNDNNEVAEVLFSLLNIVVEQMITQPKKISEIYGSLPQSALDGIEKRDK